MPNKRPRRLLLIVALALAAMCGTAQAQAPERSCAGLPENWRGGRVTQIRVRSLDCRTARDYIRRMDWTDMGPQGWNPWVRCQAHVVTFGPAGWSTDATRARCWSAGMSLRWVEYGLVPEN